MKLIKGFISLMIKLIQNTRDYLPSLSCGSEFYRQTPREEVTMLGNSL